METWKFHVLKQYNIMRNNFHFSGTDSDVGGAGSGAATPTQLNPVTRKKKPKRRSTGVVNLDIDVSLENIFSFFMKFFFLQDHRSEESADEVSLSFS